MSIWSPPYRICVIKSDTNSVEALETALLNNPNWEIIYADNYWRACLFAINSGLHAILLGNSPEKMDINLSTLDEIRFFACQKLPVPYLLIKTSSEMNEISNQPSPYPLSKKIKSIGIVNQLKFELANIINDFSNRSSAWHAYSDFQFNTFIKGNHEEPGSLLRGNFPDHYLVHARVSAYISEKKYAVAEALLLNETAKHPLNPFLHATAAHLYYCQDQVIKAREKLDFFVTRSVTHPIIPYMAFTLIDEFQDYHYQRAVLDVLISNFPNSYPTHLTSAIWNIKLGHTELGITQLFGCVDQMPQDVVAGAKLMRALYDKGYKGLCSGVKNHVSSTLLNTNLYHYMYANLLGIKD